MMRSILTSLHPARIFRLLSLHSFCVVALGLGAASSHSANKEAIQDSIELGGYLTQLLACGRCHTEGELLGTRAG